MLCNNCSYHSRFVHHSPVAVPEHLLARLAEVICTRCGTILPLPDSTTALLRTLSQLAQFGLSDAGTPILELDRSKSNRCGKAA